MEINESILIAFIKGDLPSDQHDFVQERLSNDEELFKTYVELKDIWDYTGLKTNALQYDKKSDWERVSKAIDKNTGKMRVLSFAMRVASIAAVVVLSFYLGHKWYNPSDTSAQFTSHVFTSPQGELSELKLADGSEVILNAGSSLTVPMHFGSKNREVLLNGEAHFKVSKNPDLSFVVQSKQQSVKVLGTIFNVRAYANEDQMITTLEEGLVEWAADGQYIKLKPGMQVVYHTSTKRIEQKMVNANKVSQWSIGRYEFEDAEFANIVDVIERWYNVEISWSKADFAGQHFNGVIKKSASLNETLELIEIMTPIKYSIDGQKVSIARMK